MKGLIQNLELVQRIALFRLVRQKFGADELLQQAQDLKYSSAEWLDDKEEPLPEKIPSAKEGNSPRISPPDVEQLSAEEKTEKWYLYRRLQMEGRKRRRWDEEEEGGKRGKILASMEVIYQKKTKGYDGQAPIRRFY